MGPQLHSLLYSQSMLTLMKNGHERWKDWTDQLADGRDLGHVVDGRQQARDGLVGVVGDQVDVEDDKSKSWHSRGQLNLTW